jgi:uncharacterized Zn-binding protein involved in type VI secretion
VCPVCKRVTTIVSSRFPLLTTESGRPAAYDGDVTDCGAVLRSRHNGRIGFAGLSTSGEEAEEPSEES